MYSFFSLQVEFSYPPLLEDAAVDSPELPEEWKHLPSLAIPDGAHNFLEDTVFFHLPSRENYRKTVYGISCYRQIAANELINKAADVTRATVQKSVCVLSRYPVFGVIQAKMELITHAYFDERDFSKVSLLEETYRNLNAGLTHTILETQLFLGLSVRDLVLQYRHKLLILFKLLLLEKRVLFFGSPVKLLSGNILSLLSLFPGMLEMGIDEAVYYRSKNLCDQTELTQIGLQKDEYNQRIEEPVDVQNVSFSLTDETDWKKEELAPAASPLEEECEYRVDDVNKDSGEMLVDNIRDSAVECEKFCDSTGEEGTSQIDTDHRICSDASGENLLDVQAINQQKTCSVLKGSTDSGIDAHSLDTAEVSVDSKTSEQSLSPIQWEGCEEKESIDNSLDKHYSRQIENGSVEGNITLEPRNSAQSLEHLDDVTIEQVVESDADLRTETPGEDHLGQMISHDRERNSDWEDEEFLKEIDAVLKEGAREKDQSSLSSSQSDSQISLTSKYGVSKMTSFLSKMSTAVSQTSSDERRKSEADVVDEQVSTSTRQLVGRISPTTLETLSFEDCGFPLDVFSKGSVCYPYMTLGYLDSLSDPGVQTFIGGATNGLFKHKKHMFDVIVEVEESKMEVQDAELNRQLGLTAADLRFADYVTKIVTEVQDDDLLNGTLWQGGDEWIRVQFKWYLVCLLSTWEARNHPEGQRALEDFNMNFVNAWIQTNNHEVWKIREHVKMSEEFAGHPFTGQISIADARLRMQHVLQNTERGRKVLSH